MGVSSYSRVISWLILFYVHKYCLLLLLIIRCTYSTLAIGNPGPYCLTRLYSTRETELTLTGCSGVTSFAEYSSLVLEDMAGTVKIKRPFKRDWEILLYEFSTTQKKLSLLNSVGLDQA